MPAHPRPWPTGTRVAPRWRGTRLGRIDDIVCFVPGENAGDRRGGHRCRRRAGGPHGLPRLHHLPEPRPRGHRPGDRGLEGASPARAALPDLRADLRRWSGLLPDRCDRARARLRGRPAPHGHHHQLHHRHPGAVPGPDRDRALRPRVRPARRHRRRRSVLSRHRTAGGRGADRPCGWPPSGPPRPRNWTKEAAWAVPGVPSSAGSPAASPMSNDPDLVNRIF